MPTREIVRYYREKPWWLPRRLWVKFPRSSETITVKAEWDEIDIATRWESAP